MYIKRMKLKNFRQFKDETNIEFSTSKDHNITLILGDNTSGKTTLLQAFLWCLYENANFKRKDALLNTEVAYEMLRTQKSEDVEISLEIEYGQRTYYITRTKNYFVDSGEVRASKISLKEMLYKDLDGQMKTVDKHLIDKTISQILPMDLSSYFFYDTERFGNVTTKADVTDAVKGLLGLTVLENTIRHLGSETKKSSVLGKFNNSLDVRGNENAENARKEMEEATEQLDVLEKRYKAIEKEIDRLKLQHNEKEEKIKDLADAQRLQQDREQNRRDLGYEKSRLESAQKHFVLNFRNNTFSFLAKPAIDKALEVLVDADVADKGINDMTANSIKEIISRGKCICGAHIEDGNEAFEHIMKELQYLPPESIGNLIKNFKEKSEILGSNASNYFGGLESSHAAIVESRNQAGKLEDVIEELNNRLKGQESVREYEIERQDIEKTINQKERQRESIAQDIALRERTIKEKKAEYDKYVAASSKNKQIMEYMAYAYELLKWVRNRYDHREAQIKKQLEEKVNYYFKQMYHGNRKVEIDDNYRIRLITTSADQEIITDESQGLETVKNFSFIAGLVDLAKQKLESDSKEELQSEKDNEDYPLVLDAPFSNADERHVENISKALPEVASQLILIVMSKDWNYAEKSLGYKVGKRYQLVKESEVLTKVVEV